jgi:hypothetical protein
MTLIRISYYSLVKTIFKINMNYLFNLLFHKINILDEMKFSLLLTRKKKKLDIEEIIAKKFFLFLFFP